MALNYSQRPIFGAHTSERVVNGGYVVEGKAEKGGDDKSGPTSDSKDIVDLLPSDPFGMDIDISTTFTTITGWFGDVELDYGDYRSRKIVNCKEDYGLFAGFNFFWNSAMRFQSFPSSNFMYQDDNKCSMVVDLKDLNDLNMNMTSSTKVVIGGGDAHEAFVLALGYLGTRDLLMVEMVSRSLCYTVRNDSLLWRNLVVDQPLNEKITDDVLVRLSDRAHGNLQCLSLIKCPKITDDGLKRVLETNPKLMKLSVPGCTRLSIEGILNNLKAFKSCTETGGIKHIRTGGFYGITIDHFEQLKGLLGIIQKSDWGPRYYHRGNLYLGFDDDDRAIDVEVCPRCLNLRLVYDCPAEGCEECRACIICIPRCAECGRCVHNSEYEETFSLEYLCSDCLKQLPRCLEEPQDMKIDDDNDDVIDICVHG